MFDDQIEQEIQDKELTAPRLTPMLIRSKIKAEQYYVFPNTTLTVCCLTLENGFIVAGESAYASLESFDKELGRTRSYNNAVGKIWLLEGYVLKEKLYRQEITL